METNVRMRQLEPAAERAPARGSGIRTHTDPRLLASVFVGGALGAGARAGLADLFPSHAGSWPWAIFLINVGGAILLAFFATRLQERLPPAIYKRPFLGTGVCGALTTFSTLQVELVQMGRDGHYSLALAYVAASAAVGLVAVFVTTGLTRRARIAQ
jgi:CrcB protein